MSNDAAALKQWNNSLFVFEVQITRDYACRLWTYLGVFVSFCPLTYFVLRHLFSS